jgi:hypothetical protein
MMDCRHIKHFDCDYKKYYIINSCGNSSNSGSSTSNYNNNNNNNNSISTKSITSSERDSRLCTNTAKICIPLQRIIM